MTAPIHATNASAIGSTLNAIATAANAVSSTFSVATKSIGMLDAVVTKAADQQQARILADAETFDQRLAHEVAFDISNMELAASQFLAKNPQLASTYTTHYESFLTKLQSRKAAPAT